MNSINEGDVDKFSEDPGALVALVDSVLNKLIISINDSELRQKQAQLIEVSRTIDQLTNLSIPIPDELRKLKLSLLKEIENKTQSREEFGQILSRFGDIVARINASYSTKPAKRKRTRKRKSTLPQTKQKFLTNEIIYALRILGGSGTPREVKEIIEERMKDKFLSGDLVMSPTARMLVWKSNVHWARLKLKNEEILKSDSPKGTWELSEEYI